MFSHHEYYEMARCYVLSGEILEQARRLYEAERLPRLRNLGLVNAVIPSTRTFLAANQRLSDHGQFKTPAHAQGRGRVELPANIELQILEFFEQKPTDSTRDASRRFGVSHYAVWKLLKTEEMHAYHFQSVQALHEPDAASRRAFVRGIAHPAAVILWTDEALHSRGAVQCP